MDSTSTAKEHIDIEITWPSTVKFSPSFSLGMYPGK